MLTTAVVIVLLAGAQGVAGEVGVGSKKLGFTNTNIQANPFGSCPLVLGRPSGDSRDTEVWQFDRSPDCYPGTWGCFDDSASECSAPWPNTNIYSEDEEIIAVFESRFEDDQNEYRIDCPLNLTQFAPGYSGPSDSKSTSSPSQYTLDCPLTCFECAKACEMQANSVSQADTFRDPTLQGCNAWVFCTNPMGCKHSGGTVPGFSCTLKRIPMQNPGIQMLMAADGGTTLEFRENVVVAPPKALVDQSSSGTGSDFVSGICNVRQTCTNTPDNDFQCDENGGCGNCDRCGEMMRGCAGPCCPSCRC